MVLGVVCCHSHPIYDHMQALQTFSFDGVDTTDDNRGPPPLF